MKIVSSKESHLILVERIERCTRTLDIWCNDVYRVLKYPVERLKCHIYVFLNQSYQIFLGKIKQYSLFLTYQNSIFSSRYESNVIYSKIPVLIFTLWHVHGRVNPSLKVVPAETKQTIECFTRSCGTRLKTFPRTTGFLGEKNSFEAPSKN